MGNSTSSHQPLERGTFGDIKNVKSSSFRSSKRFSPKKMDRLRKSFRDSFRRRKDRVPEASKPHLWQTDEQEVRSATCAFPVKYLGCVEVFESRGMQVCEEAIKVLRNSRRRPIRGQLHVSGDGLRVVDDDTKGLIVDQTIEKVSFCAPDRNHERGFSYICRDGTTRRWMCHGFLATKDSGERLSHAVGCAFAVCLERKQRRDKECSVTMTFDMKNSTFTRTGSFRQQTMTERLADPPSAAIAPQPKSAFNPFAIERPHATPSMLERQGSFRGFTQIGAQSPFKRQMSLRINDLPSNAERQRAFLDTNIVQRLAVSPIPENSVSTQQVDTVSELCKELSQGLQMLSKDTENFLNFEKIANGIIGSSNSDDINIPSPPSCKSSNVAAPYRPLAASSVQNSSIPIGTATPFKLQPIITLKKDEVKYSSLAADLSPTLPTVPESFPRTSPARTSSPLPPTSPQKVLPIQTTQALPKAEQWLTEIVRQASPSPKRAPSINSRSKSLAEVDPIENAISEWKSTPASSLQTTPPPPLQAPTSSSFHSTNPFVSPANQIQQSFQVQL